MRRLAALLSAALMSGTLLAVGAGAATAAPAVQTAAGFTCSPNGTLPGSPTTTLSTATVDFGSPSRSHLECYFRGSRLATSFGGPCAYETATYRVDFRSRILLASFGGPVLLCWGGSITIFPTHTLTTLVRNENGRDTRLFDSISYGTTSCTNLREDGTTPCAAAFVVNTVVNVDLQDEAFFRYTCPGGAILQNAAGTGPYTGSCSVAMDADKTIDVLGDANVP